MLFNIDLAIDIFDKQVLYQLHLQVKMNLISIQKESLQKMDVYLDQMTCIF